MADMDIAIGVRGAIMQNEFGAARGHFPHLRLQIHLFPMSKPLRFTLRQISLHGKGGAGKIQRLFVICHF